jgi:acyl-CoA synthetase (AMP-forming)/AMP-acid ligase II
MQLLPEALRAHAARSPGAPALLDGSRSVTYGELVRDALQVAAGLRALGVAPGDRVALALSNSPEAVACIYGTWFAGAVAVLLNAQARGHEIGTWTRHAEARVLVLDAEYRGRDEVTAGLSAQGVAVVAPGALTEQSDEQSDQAAAVAATDLAILLYTSGTTGAPKGVMLSHGNLAANVHSIVSYLALTSADKVLSVLPFYYAYGSSVLHTHLFVGGCVVLERNFVFPHIVLETMARTQVTGFSGVPSTFALLLSRVRMDPAQLPSLRYLTQAGAAMSPALTAKLRAALPGVQLFIMYGQTEATSRLTYLPPHRLDDKPGSAGIPISNVEIQIRDEHGCVAAPGVSGELWARGPNVMLGYWRDEAATRATLQNGWLRTGDVGYVDDEGYLFLSGRRSDIIKTGANRVHPLEIEEVVAEVAGVQEVAAAGVDDEVLGQAIVVYVVRHPTATITPEIVKAHCRARLAAYKVPKAVEFVSGLPRTESGKIKRFELQALGRKETA